MQPNVKPKNGVDRGLGGMVVYKPREGGKGLTLRHNRSRHLMPIVRQSPSTMSQAPPPP
jgi:hypothetical protein